MIGTVVSTAAIVIGALAWALNTFDLLPKKKSAADAAAEIQIAHQAAERIAAELAREQAKTRELERTRSLEPILQRLTENAEHQARVLEKLASFNGSLKSIHRGLDDTTRSLAETREGLSAAVEAIKFIAGQVVTDYIPAAPPPAPRRRRATVKKEQP